ncbi:MAG: hypothetical protein CM15mP74_08260 [Halieaceae bacterium]|nr:MAG: hypothetical protein CM15mP74_08260 [Halieaceae bacterium]
MLLKLSTFLRFALERDDMSLTTLREELMAIELYLDIEKVRFSDRLAVEITVAPDAYRCNVPSLLLQPIVENAIKYAIAKSVKGGKITVDARLDGGSLVSSSTTLGLIRRQDPALTPICRVRSWASA